MKPESEGLVPDWAYIDASLETFSIGDEFGNSVVNLMRELRSKESESVWAKRLALYEVARRTAWLRSFLSLSDEARGGLMFARFTIHEIRRLSEQARVVTWGEVDEVVRGKDVILEHGSYRSIPTMAHVSYVNYGTVGQIGANMNILSMDAASVIRGRKGENTIVLADDLRTEFWKHVPGVDVVVVTKEFDPKNAKSFWTEETYPRLSKAAKSLTLMCSYGDQVANEKNRYARLSKKIDVRMVYRENWARDFGDPLYPQWTTTQWDEVSGRHEEFEKLARQYLVR
ncbi:MAG: hypothetical protein WAV40_04580 [Microgenomates group bacterium]